MTRTTTRPGAVFVHGPANSSLYMNHTTVARSSESIIDSSSIRRGGSHGDRALDDCSPPEILERQGQESSSSRSSNARSSNGDGSSSDIVSAAECAVAHVSVAIAVAVPVEEDEEEGEQVVPRGTAIPVVIADENKLPFHKTKGTNKQNNTRKRYISPRRLHS
jgi:hypothetical protein